MHGDGGRGCAGGVEEPGLLQCEPYFHCGGRGQECKGG